MRKTEIETILFREIKKYIDGAPFSEKSLNNDIDVLLNMYSKNKEKVDPEDKSVSPFSQLGLLKKIDGRYIKSHPNKAQFPDEVILYELAMKLTNNDEGISIEKFLLEDGGLVKIFNMTAVMANDYFDRLDASGYLHVDRTAGLDMIYPVKDLNPLKVVEDYYKNN